MKEVEGGPSLETRSLNPLPLSTLGVTLTVGGRDPRLSNYRGTLG